MKMCNHNTRWRLMAAPKSIKERPETSRKLICAVRDLSTKVLEVDLLMRNTGFSGFSIITELFSTE